MRLMHGTTFTPFPGAQSVALGLFRNDTNGHRVLIHDGDLSGFHTDLEMLPDEGVGFFVSVNQGYCLWKLGGHKSGARLVPSSGKKPMARLGSTC